MKKTLIQLLFLLVSAGCLLSIQAVEPPSNYQITLEKRLQEFTCLPEFDSALWGIQINSTKSGKRLFALNENHYFIPASNVKLFSSALALDRLGPDYTVSTSIYSISPPDIEGQIKGDLIVFGRGDPGFLSESSSDQRGSLIDGIVNQLIQLGIKSVEGNIVGDASYFNGPPLGLGWEWDDFQWYYGAEVSSLNFNGNCLDVSLSPGSDAGSTCRITQFPDLNYLEIINHLKTGLPETESSIRVFRPIGSNRVFLNGVIPAGSSTITNTIAIHDSAAFFASWMRSAMIKAGIEVNGKAFGNYKTDLSTAVRKRRDKVELVRVSSPPLREILTQTQKTSSNQNAQLLLLHAGISRENRNIHSGEAPSQSKTTEEHGIEEMYNFIAEVGIPAEDALIEEGSGLSRRNRLKPSAVVQLLRYMARHEHATVYIDSLPIAGVDGTLRKRFQDSPAKNNLRAKTGSLRYARALSGFLTNQFGEPLVFSIFLNDFHSKNPDVSLTDFLDQIVEIIIDPEVSIDSAR